MTCDTAVYMLASLKSTLYLIFAFHLVNPRYGNMLGGTAIKICVLAVLSTDTIECKFGDTSLPGVYLSDTEILCVSPRFSEPGPVALQYTISRDGETMFEGERTFHVCKL